MWAKIKAWWSWSRTIFINVGISGLLMLNEIVTYLVGADWASIIHNPKLLFGVTVGINILNVFLRTITTTPVGGKGSQ